MSPTRKLRRFTKSDRLDPLGLKALEEAYSTLPRAEIVAARTTDIDMLATVRARLTEACDIEGLRILSAFSREERVLIAEFERKELTGG